MEAVFTFTAVVALAEIGDKKQLLAIVLATRKADQRRVLVTVLIINTVMFVGELGVGIFAHSAALIADSADMFGDAFVYALSLYALNRGDRWKAGAALAKGLDAPYSCQGGVCSSCLAKVTEGAAEMEKNTILDEDEVAEGLILTCQAHPTTPNIKIDFDDV